eukprot:CAMPEP_0197555950 /NCGR_PEP_ID=MMETSP1320-20131121/14285_1 /TAXON_ID=91990 /ORGANISM="Bolidomonas sp., Strain RCC2347" /LENGTH=74 /DNA_ID=CAMNT_0043117021 /DNA_START=21 /DNA_END=242 /DNA_ORIENTATION=+
MHSVLTSSFVGLPLLLLILVLTCVISPLALGLSATAPSNPFKAPAAEVMRRRNIAIISHPDSGKTTMTEKLLLH